MFKEFTYPSANGQDHICAWAYIPFDKPKGIVQFLHGVGDHSRRYMHTIYRLLDAGYAVYAADALGHGKTGVDGGNLGFPRTHDYMDYIKDEKALHDIAAADYPGLPYFMLGHSWGTIKIRTYATLFGEDLAGFILSGIVARMEGLDIESDDPDFEAAAKADPHASAGEWGGKVFLNMCRRIPDPQTPNDFASLDHGNVLDYIADPFCGLDGSMWLYFDGVTQMYKYVMHPDWASKVPSNIPVLNIFGDEDPAGGFGLGGYAVSNMLADNGNPVTTRAYSKYRHDLLTDRGIRDQMIDEIIAFLDAITA